MRSARDHEQTAAPRARPAVLVVDDHAPNLLALSELLAPTGVEVVCVGSGEAALRAVLERDFAVILMDLRMAPMSGLDTARLLRQRERRRVPIVFVTAADVAPADIRAAYDAGAADFLARPLTPEILRAKVSFFVELQTARDELREQERRRRARDLEALSSQAQAQQRELARLQKLFQHAGWGMVMVDPETTRIIDANPAFAHLHGYDSAEELLGRQVEELFAPSSRAEFAARSEETFARGAHSFEQLHVRKDGSVFPVIADAVSLRDEHGRVVFRGASLQDLTERKRLEQALRDSEEESRSIVETLAEGVVIIDHAGTFVKANAGAGRILGISPDQLLGQSLFADDWSAIREDGSDFPHDEHPARVALRTGQAQSKLMGLKVGEGRILWLLLNATPMRRGSAPESPWVVVSFFDITERREAELARRRSEDLLRTLIDAMPVLVSYVSYEDGELRYQLNNLGYERWLGVDRFSNTGKTMPEVLGAEAYAAIRPYVDAVLRGETVRYQRELPYRTGARMVEATYIPHRSPEGQVIGFVVMVQDIGERIRSEREKAELLRREQDATARLRLLARTSRVLSELSMRTDEALHRMTQAIAESFATYCGVFGVVDEGEALVPRGMSHRDPATERALNALMGSGRVRIPSAAVRGTLAAGEVVRLEGGELAELRAALPPTYHAFVGAHPPRELLCTPLRIGERLIGVLVAGRGVTDPPFDDEDRLLLQDIAERAALALEAARLYEEEKKAKEAAELRADFEDRFIGIVSHDIRSPVTALKMASLLLRRSSGLPESAGTQLDRIDRCAKRVEQITALLLDFTRARIGSGIQIDPQPVSLGELCLKAVEEQQLAHPDRRIRCEGDARVHADAGRIAQALVNLVENAVKYGKSEGEIVVRAQQTEGGATLSVHNAGPPIDRRHIGSLFQPFSRGAQTEETVKLSLGLGLFIVREIARAHGGDVGVVSSPEHGTTFTVTLPVHPPAAEPPRVR